MTKQKKKIAVIWFPGTNCEDESKRACESAGMEAEIIRWNDTKNLEHFDGYVIPGGWSYEDRIRAGVIAAKDPLVIEVKRQAERGKIVLGICNGCQVLVEAGLIPGNSENTEKGIWETSRERNREIAKEGTGSEGVQNGKITMALAPNVNPIVSGYFCAWVYVKKISGKENAFSRGIPDIMPIPIAHGEGRFVTKDKKLIAELEKNGQVLFKYCGENGNVADRFPINPNGAVSNIAGIINPRGNVLAMMPHPERASWMHQVPGHIREGEAPGPGRKIFESMRDYLIK
ncbi:phosphoribosylformylglycinamidine synthase I [Candidatus Woesearchaeota archaeon]|nr:phosphoribosylformylglycinamidine synthase I [Candidatus Woesearchaeota archaeon]